MSLAHLESTILQYRQVVWDWNGTLLDDVDCCVQIIVDVMTQYGLKPITKQEYLDKFRFPVIEYYKDIGFDFNVLSFEEIAKDWIQAYNQRCEKSHIFKGMKDLIKSLHDHGIKSHILTAADEKDVVALTKKFEIYELFTNIFGQNNYHAVGKLTRGQELVAAISAGAGEVVLVGDTDHDAEVALALEFDCILLDGGHQSPRDHDKLVKKFSAAGRSLRFVARR